MLIIAAVQSHCPYKQLSTIKWTSSYFDHWLISFRDFFQRKKSKFFDSSLSKLNIFLFISLFIPENWIFFVLWTQKSTFFTTFWHFTDQTTNELMKTVVCLLNVQVITQAAVILISVCRFFYGNTLIFFVPL